MKVYDPLGRRILVVGRRGDGLGEFRFPCAVAVAREAGELYVADQGNHRVEVFDLEGNFHRSFGGRVTRHAFEGRLARIQSLAVIEDNGEVRVHVADTGLNRIQILTPTGEFLEIYGETGRRPGELNLPLDIAASPAGRILACNAGNARVEVVR